ncbi:unnamed protein product [Umbelopsis ramanniana]
MKISATLSVFVLSLSIAVATTANENVAAKGVTSGKQAKAENRQLWASDDQDEKHKNKDTDNGSHPGNSNGCADSDCQGSINSALDNAMVPLLFGTITVSVPCASGTVDLSAICPPSSVGSACPVVTAVVQEACPTPASVVKTITVSGQLVTITVPAVEQTIVQTATVTGIQTSTVTVTVPAATTQAACPHQNSDIYVRCENPLGQIARNAEANAYLADEFARQTLRDGCFMVTEWRGDDTSPAVYYRVDTTRSGVVEAYRSACNPHGIFRCSSGYTGSDDITCPT